jgi:signal transduction histidine kinase
MTALSRNYVAALSTHLKKGSRSGLKAAKALGQKAASLGLTTLDLAGVHEQSLYVAASPADQSDSDSDNQRDRQAQEFFSIANLQIERAHDTPAKTRRQWNEINAALRERTAELAFSKRDVKKTIVQRKAAEETLRASNDHYAKLCKESRSMQVNLRRLAHRVLAAQERERGQISRELRDEIAQVLLGINLRLLTLERQGTSDARKLLKEIANTQRLVDKSIKQMGQAAARVSRT